MNDLASEHMVSLMTGFVDAEVTRIEYPSDCSCAVANSENAREGVVVVIVIAIAYEEFDCYGHADEFKQVVEVHVACEYPDDSDAPSTATRIGSANSEGARV